MSDREFRVLAETALESRLWLAAAEAARVWSAAWRESAAGRAGRRAAAQTRDWRALDRARYGAIAVASMALGHLGLVALVPVYVAPALPLTFMLLVAMLAAGIAAAPGGFIRGWHQSRLQRVGRRLAARPQNNDA